MSHDLYLLILWHEPAPRNEIKRAKRYYVGVALAQTSFHSSMWGCARPVSEYGCGLHFYKPIMLLPCRNQKQDYWHINIINLKTKRIWWHSKYKEKKEIRWSVRSILYSEIRQNLRMLQELSRWFTPEGVGFSRLGSIGVWRYLRIRKRRKLLTFSFCIYSSN